MRTAALQDAGARERGPGTGEAFGVRCFFWALLVPCRSKHDYHFCVALRSLDAQAARGAEPPLAWLRSAPRGRGRARYPIRINFLLRNYLLHLFIVGKQLVLRRTAPASKVE